MTIKYTWTRPNTDNSQPKGPVMGWSFKAVTMKEAVDRKLGAWCSFATRDGVNERVDLFNRGQTGGYWSTTEEVQYHGRVAPTDGYTSRTWVIIFTKDAPDSNEWGEVHP